MAACLLVLARIFLIPVVAVARAIAWLEEKFSPHRPDASHVRLKANAESPDGSAPASKAGLAEQVKTHRSCKRWNRRVYTIMAKCLATVWRIVQKLELAEVSNEIFKEQLNGWNRVRSVWPATRDLEAFLLRFDCSFHSMVVDVCDERLRHEGM